MRPLIIILATVLGLYIIELGLILSTPVSGWDRVTRLPEWDSRSKGEVLRDLRAQGVQAWPACYPNLFLNRVTPVLPLAGLSQVTTLLCNESGKYAFYGADYHGFNNPDDAWRKPQVVLVGDSYTHGACVSQDEGIAGHLRAMGIPTLNLGMGGNGPLYQLATIREYAQGIPVVAWIYFEGNDLLDLSREISNLTLQRYLADRNYKQGLKDRQGEIDHMITAYIESQWVDRKPEKKSRLVDFAFLRNLRKRTGLIPGPEATVMPPYEDLLKSVLSRAKEETNLIFVYLPHFARFDPRFKVDLRKEEVISVVHSLGIPVIDIHETMLKDKDPLRFFPHRLNGHFNGIGYEFIAKEIQRWLEDS